MSPLDDLKRAIRGDLESCLRSAGRLQRRDAEGFNVMMELVDRYRSRLAAIESLESDAAELHEAYMRIRRALAPEAFATAPGGEDRFAVTEAALAAKLKRLAELEAKWEDHHALHAHCKRTLTDGEIANLFGERMTEIVNALTASESAHLATRRALVAVFDDHPHFYDKPLELSALIHAARAEVAKADAAKPKTCGECSKFYSSGMCPNKPYVAAHESACPEFHPRSDAQKEVQP